MTNFRDQITHTDVRKRSIPDSVYMSLRSLIVHGEFSEGDQLPSEMELADLYRVSRTTVREALNRLQQEGTIIRKHGVGTFVGPSYSLVSRLDVNMGGAELIRSLGLTPGISDVNINIISADDKLSRKLNVLPGEELISIDRIQTANNAPVIYSIVVFPAAYLKRIQEEFDLQQLNELMNLKLSIYGIFEDYLGFKIKYGIAKVHPAIAGSVLPEKMGVPHDDVVMWIDQVNYDTGGNPVLASEHFYVSSVFTFTVFRKRM